MNKKSNIALISELLLQFTNFKGLNWLKFSQSELGGPWEAFWAREILQGPQTGIADCEEFPSGRLSIYQPGTSTP